MGSERSALSADERGVGVAGIEPEGRFGPVPFSPPLERLGVIAPGAVAVPDKPVSEVWPLARVDRKLSSGRYGTTSQASPGKNWR